MNLSQLSEADRNDELTRLTLEHQVLSVIVKQLLITSPEARAAVQQMATKSADALMPFPLTEEQIQDLQAYLQRFC